MDCHWMRPPYQSCWELAPAIFRTSWEKKELFNERKNGQELGTTYIIDVLMIHIYIYT